MGGLKAQTDAPARDAICRTARALTGVSSAVIRACSVDGNVETDCLALIAEICRRALEARSLVVVPDLARDISLAPVASGVGPAAPRFCAAVPLVGGGTEPAFLGALVLLDPAPRELSALQRAQLLDLCVVAASLLRLEAAARVAAEQAGLYRLLADNSTDTIVRGNLYGVRLYVSPAVTTLLGYEPEELVGKRAMDIVHPDDLANFQQLMLAIREGRIEHGRSEQRQRHKNGSWVWIEAFIRLTYDKASGRPDGYVVSVRDISRRKAAELRLAHLATHDALTGLANRSLLQERLDQMVARASPPGSGFAVLCIDLDCFKQVNDTLGHAAGDAVLRAAAERLAMACRADDLVARLGGDEFVIVMGTSPAPLAAAERLAARLIEVMAPPIAFSDTVITVGVSIGIACAASDDSAAGRCVESVLRAGDKALYAAKEAGRNRYVVAPAPSA